jgi:hypothetical protein
MKKVDMKKLLPPLLVLLAVSLLFSACAANNPDAEDAVIIEPGLTDEETAEDNTDDEANDSETSAELFVDKGELTTVEDLAAAQAKIQSYYFEQTIPYTDASVFLQVWYYAHKMKVVTSVDGYGLTEFYYDYDAQTIISYSPADSDTAIQMYFDAASEDAPDNPLDDDYTACTFLGSEEIDRQLCYILETPEGDKLWVSTKYGFPYQVEFIDHLGEQYTVAYRNIEINTLTEESVQVPADLPIYNLDTGTGE